MRDIEGKRFGKWTVIKDSGERAKSREIIWECRCDCGTIRNVKFKILKNESKPRSCGCSRKIRSKEIFDSNYEKTSGCWNWSGAVNSRGYGKIGNNDLAHRRAYEYVYGKISKGLCVCHKCDNRLCVNPAHLFLGTIGQNLQDMTDKGRRARGSKIASSILTEDQVRQIRNKREAGALYSELAEEFNVSWTNIKYIIKRKSWKHVS